MPNLTDTLIQIGGPDRHGLCPQCGLLPQVCATALPIVHRRACPGAVARAGLEDVGYRPTLQAERRWEGAYRP